MRLLDAGPAYRDRVRLLAERLCRVVAIAVVASLNVAGWIVIFSGAWRIGLWIVLLSAGIAAVVLWDGGRD